MDEYRSPLTPAGVRGLLGRGHEVLIQAIAIVATPIAVAACGGSSGRSSSGATS